MYLLYARNYRCIKPNSYKGYTERGGRPNYWGVSNLISHKKQTFGTISAAYPEGLIMKYLYTKQKKMAG